MDSKKNKRIKPFVEETEDIIVLDSPKRNLKRKTCENTNEDEKIEEFIEQNDISIIPKKKKKKIKSEEVSSTTMSNEVNINGIKREMKVENDLEINTIEEIKPESIELDIRDNIQKQHKINMPQNDIIELIQRIETLIPSNDTLSFRSRVDKLNWNDIVFSHYSIEECKETWNFLQKKIRHFRLLREVLKDVKDFIINPPKTRRNLYPGMPEKPPTTYNIFYEKKKPILISKNPEIDIKEISRQISQMFKNLTPEKKAKYEEKAAQLKSKYEKEIEIFYENHPEVERPLDTIKKKRIVQKKPRNPRTPFVLYFENQLKKNTEFNHEDAQAKSFFKDQCREKWKKLSIKKKVSWITKAEEDISRYEDETKRFSETHPNFVPVTAKHIISKEEVALKEKFCGKPDKPPNSAYALFFRIMLQSDEIKNINAKERMNFIAAKWKNCSEADKSEYKAKVNEIIQKYKSDYEKYLDSLPEDKKQLELQKSLPKKKSKPDHIEQEKNLKKGETKKISEPETPPISAFKYYATTEKLENKTAKKNWKSLTEEEKSNYEKKLVEIKRNYILEFEKFLNSLTKEQLEEYSKTRQELKFSSDDSSSSDTDEENDFTEDDSD